MSRLPCALQALKTGILRDVSFLDKYQNDPDVLYARPIVQPGSKVGHGRRRPLTFSSRGCRLLTPPLLWSWPLPRFPWHACRRAVPDGHTI